MVRATKRVISWIQEQGFDLLQWPPQSPDLNPIENLWSQMKRKTAAQQFDGIHELVDFLKRLWSTEITAEMCQNLVSSMPRRVAAVIKNKGYPSKY